MINQRMEYLDDFKALEGLFAKEYDCLVSILLEMGMKPITGITGIEEDGAVYIPIGN